MPETSVHTYLGSVKADRKNSIMLMLGNEAADLDSMASSIACGYLLYQQSTGDTVLPVMPIPRADFKLRTEAVCVFREAGIPLDSLVFFDEVEFDELMAAGAGLFLLDHNRLAPTLEQYNLNVRALIDHHHDEGFFRNADPRIIQNVGSTASLVGAEYHRAGLEIPGEIATILAGAILLDTVNLDERAGRVTQTDIAVAENLFPLCFIGRDELFNKAQSEKFNVLGLSTVDLLRKDFKEFQVGNLLYGISSMRLSIEEWEAMDADLCLGFVHFAAARKLDVLLSMNSFSAPHFARELIVYSKTKVTHDSLCHHLQTLSLELAPYDFTGQPQEGKGFVSCYHQGNSSVSRKKLQPLLGDY